LINIFTVRCPRMTWLVLVRAERADSLEGCSTLVIALSFVSRFEKNIWWSLASIYLQKRCLILVKYTLSLTSRLLASLFLVSHFSLSLSLSLAISLSLSLSLTHTLSLWWMMILVKYTLLMDISTLGLSNMFTLMITVSSSSHECPQCACARSLSDEHVRRRFMKLLIAVSRGEDRKLYLSLSSSVSVCLSFSLCLVLYVSVYLALSLSLSLSLPRSLTNSSSQIFKAPTWSCLSPSPERGRSKNGPLFPWSSSHWWEMQNMCVFECARGQFFRGHCLRSHVTFSKTDLQKWIIVDVSRCHEMSWDAKLWTGGTIRNSLCFGASFWGVRSEFTRIQRNSHSPIWGARRRASVSVNKAAHEFDVSSFHVTNTHTHTHWISDEYLLNVRWISDECPMNIWWISDE